MGRQSWVQSGDDKSEKAPSIGFGSQQWCFSVVKQNKLVFGGRDEADKG